MTEQQTKVIIIGATSGIGLALAERYASHGCLVGVTGRRLDKLKAFQKKHLGNAFIKQMDVSLASKAIIQFDHLVNQMDGVDIVIISAGTGFINESLNWDKEKQTIDTNVTGFCAIASHALNYFIRQKSGHLVNISSINALRGNDHAPAYGASKAFESNYMQGLRKKVAKLNLAIGVTDIQPGFVDTAMAKGEKLFWVCSPEKAARQIQKAVIRNRKLVYVSKRWWLFAWLMKLLPDWAYNRL